MKNFTRIGYPQLHRRLLFDDDKGVVEPLDEHAFGNGLVARGKHVIQFNSDEEKAVTAHRLRTLETVYHPIITFANTPFDLSQWLTNYNKSVSLTISINLVANMFRVVVDFAVILFTNLQFSLADELPQNVHILTLERWRERQVLVRLEHIFQINESSLYSKPVFVNLKVRR
jgi:lysosomal alpha-mannosidase